jgi:hypothetical protein
MAKSLKELAADSLAVQDACNLCGVAQSFALAMVDLGEYTKGTDGRNTHPITKMWVAKLAALSHTDYNLDVNAYAEVKQLAGA